MLMIKNRDSEYLNGQMVDSIKVSGMKENNTEKEFFKIIKE